MGDDSLEQKGKTLTGTANGFIKGNKSYHATQGYKYGIKYNTSKSCVVNVFDKTIGKKGTSVIRLDMPHKGAPFEHININPAISGVPDPHLKLPPGGVAVGEGVAKVCQVVNKVNKVAVPLAIALDVVQTGVAVKHDIDNNTSRNTVETVAGIAGGWSCGYGGAVGGAALGTAILPGVGTIIGAVVGGIAGGIGGQLGATALTSQISDELGYDVEEKRCKKCGRKFLQRKYLGEKKSLCPKCRESQ